MARHLLIGDGTAVAYDANGLLADGSVDIQKLSSDGPTSLVAGEGIAIVQDYTAGEDVIRGFAGGSLTASADGLIYGTGDDQMLLLAGIDSLAQVSIV